MKTTKTVEIQICDLCGSESMPWICCRCGKEACDRCRDMIHVRVERSTPDMESNKTHMRRTTVSPLHRTHNGIYCIECAKPVIKAMMECGLIEEPDDRLRAVMD